MLGGLNELSKLVAGDIEARDADEDVWYDARVEVEVVDGVADIGADSVEASGR